VSVMPFHSGDRKLAPDDRRCDVGSITEGRRWRIGKGKLRGFSQGRASKLAKNAAGSTEVTSSLRKCTIRGEQPAAD
jgi:hypothetical protein